MLRPFWRRRLPQVALGAVLVIGFGTLVSISVGLWSLIDGVIRAVLEVLPDALVADTTDDSGQPFVVGGVAVALVVAGSVLLGRWMLGLIRRYLASGLTYPALFGAATLTVVAIVGGLGLALLMGSIADGEDLHDGPHTEWSVEAWQPLALVAGVLGLTYLLLRWALARERVRPLPIETPG